MRVLQVITDTDRRGAQVFAVDLGQALADAGHHVRTVALAPGRNAEAIDVEVLGARRISVPTLRALRAAAKGFDVVIAHGSTTLPACAIALAGTNVPFVYRQISDSLYWATSRSRQARVRLGMARAAAIVTLAPGPGRVLEQHFGVPSGKLAVVPNGVPAVDFGVATADERSQARLAIGLDPGAVTALYLGALVPEKGADVAIDAVAAVPEVQLVVAGDGPERADLEERARELLGARCAFTGSIDRVRSVLDASDLVLFPSRGGDSMPATLIEAGFSALPAVATPVGAIPEVVVDHVTGVLVETAAVDAFTAVVAELAADPARREAMGGKARSHCLDRFEIGVVAQAWEQVLRGVLR